MGLDELNHFTCTEKYHRLAALRSVVFTDGLNYVATEGKAFWLMEQIACACVQIGRTNPDEWFIAMKLERGEVGATLTFDDGNGNVLKTVAIDSTDFSLASFQCFAVRNESSWVVMLPSEY